MKKLYSDANPHAIAWCIYTDTDTLQERRKQAEMYKGVISTIQAKFVALHVGLFWGIGVFAIRNNDAVQFMIDDYAMLKQLELRHSDDDFINGRMHHIDLLIKQRDLQVTIQHIEPYKNPASPLL